jgi:hypothetical protein
MKPPHALQIDQRPPELTGRTNIIDKLIFEKMIFAGFFARDSCGTQNVLICEGPGLIEVNELRARRL